MLSHPCPITGVMMNTDRIIAMPLRTRLGGTCCVPSACRNKPSTMTILVKLDTINAKNGSKPIETRITAASNGSSVVVPITGPPLKYPYAEPIADRYQPAGSDAAAAGVQPHRGLLDFSLQLKHITGLQFGERLQGQFKFAESDGDRNTDLFVRQAAFSHVH